MIRLLRQRNFALLWWGGLISMLGDWMLITALPISVYQLTGSALATSGIFVAAILPRLLFGSVAGVLVDRWDRRQVMLVCNLLLALGLTPLLLVDAPRMVWLVYLVAFAQSTTNQFFGPAEHALLPLVVDEEHLVAANALNSLNNNLARLTGPMAGGLIFAGAGLGGVVAADAATFILAALLIALVRASGRAVPEQAESQPQQSLWAELRAGLAIVGGQRTLKVLLAITAITYVGEGIMSVMFVLWINDVLRGGAPEVGYFMSAQAVGGILGGLVIGRIGRAAGPTRLLWAGAISFGLIDLALFNYPLFFGGLSIGLALIALVGVPATGMGAGMTTLMQQSVSDAYRGRVYGVFSTLGGLCYLVSVLGAGFLGERIGAIAMLNIQGGSYVLAGLFALAALRTHPALHTSRSTHPRADARRGEG